MKKLLFLLAFILLPIPLSFENVAGYTNYLTGIYWCTSHSSCMHELGHYLDMVNSWPSESDEYLIALLSYVTINKETIDNRILIALTKSPKERYATIFEIFDGDLPPSLAEFYLDLETKQYIINLRNSKIVIPV